MAPSPGYDSSFSTSYMGDWLEPLAQIGYATKGFVYLLIGVLAFQAAINMGGSTEGTRGAILTIGDSPFGQVLIAMTALGLFGYALWRFVEAWLDPHGEGSDAKGIAKRGGYATSGLVYLGLAVWSAWIVLGAGGGGSANGSSQREWTATVLAQPFGQWLVGLAGAVVVGVGVYHFKKAYQNTFMRRYRTGSMTPTQRQWAKRAGTFGLTARGVAFCVIGGFLIEAAREADPSETRGLSGALETLEQQPYGPWLLGLVALGFVAYGIHCFALARFSRINV